MESQCQLQSVLNMSITRELNGYKQSNASNAPLSQRSINDVLVDKTLFQMVSVSNSGTVNTSLYSSPQSHLTGLSLRSTTSVVK